MITRLLAAAVLTLAPAAFAQSTYIVPEGECGSVTLHATNGTDFPNLGTSIGADRVASAYVYVPNRRIAVQPAAGAHSLDFNADVPDNGVVMASVAFAPATTRSETHTEYAKAFIRCGAVTAKDDWQTDSGLGLEIFPQWNGQMPLKPGQPMHFIAVDKATHSLVRRAEMELYRAGEGRVATAMPDSGGIVTFPYDKAGRYMVTTTYRHLDPKIPGHWVSETSTLTFDMK